MRTSLILLASVVILAACENDAETTAPRKTAAAASSTATTDVQATANQPPASARPPKGPVVTTVVSDLATIDGVTETSNVVWALCPTGTTLVGGGHRIEGGFTLLHVVESGPFQGGANGWVVSASGPAGWQSAFRAVAHCLQM